MLFRQLNTDEEKQFRAWARENYTPLSPISGVWHTVVQDECRRMNEERAAMFTVETEIGIPT